MAAGRGDNEKRSEFKEKLESIKKGPQNKFGNEPIFNQAISAKVAKPGDDDGGVLHISDDFSCD